MDGEEHEKECESFSDSEVHVCVILTESLCVPLKVNVLLFKLALFIILLIESEM